MSSYPLLTTLNGKRWDISSNNITTTNYISCNGGSQPGTYYSNNGNAVRFPAGSTALRPSPAYNGYLRYNTDTSVNSFEYFISETNQWVPIISPPTISSIFPTYVTDLSGAGGYYNINPLIITGTGFQGGATVAYRSQSGVLYYPGDVSYNSTFTLKASVPALVYSGVTGHGDDPFSIIVTNPSGLFAILSDALDSNPVPVWTTAAGSLGTFDASTNLTTQVQVVATDTEGQPIGYRLTPGNSLPPGISLGETTGYITGILPTLPNSTTYSFSIDASDNTTRVPRSFSLTVNGPRTATVSFPSTTWTYTIGYTNSSGTGYTTSAPYPSGYTIYQFFPSALTPNTSQANGGGSQQDPTVYTQNSATATYTFVPNFSSATCSILLVGGGGAGAADGGTAPGNGGGGGGGVLYNSGGVNGVSLTSGTSYTITVGAGGYGATGGVYKRNGANTTMTGTSLSLTAYGGGGGGWYSAGWGAQGGSGGGAGASSSGTGSGTQASIASPSTNFTSYQSLGSAPSSTGGGGGGASNTGTGTTGNVNGGAGIPIGIVDTVSLTTYAGGGGGTPGGTGGSGGGGNGGNPAINGTNGLGGGGGSQGNSNANPSGNGGTGIVIIKFKTYSG